MMAVGGLRVSAVAALLVCAVGAPAFAQTEWGQIRVPGGVAAAREVARLGGPDRPPVNFLVDVGLWTTGTPLGDEGSAASELAEYFTYLEHLRAALDRLPDGLALGNGEELGPGSQRAVGEALSLIGLRLEQGLAAPAVAVEGAAPGRRDGWLEAVGIRIDEVAGRLNAGEVVVLAWPDDVVPLPLPELWRTRVFDASRLPIASLVADPSATLFYRGLLDLDRETLAWLGTQPQLFRKLHADLAGPLAAFGRGFHVRQSSVVVPGGATNVPVWEDLVGARVTDPASFLTRMLSRDAGRLAYFYLTAAHLDPERRAFLLGGEFPGRAARQDRARFVRRVYDQFVRFAPAWRARERSFSKPHPDPGLVLAVVDVAPDGTLGPAWWPRLLERAALGCSWNDEPAPSRARFAAGDAEWLLRWLIERPGAFEERFGILTFLQRRFADAPESESPHIALALCARVEMPALALALERMGLDSPETYATLASVSRRLTRTGSQTDVARNLRTWQGAIALTEQAVRHRDLPASRLSELLAALTDAAPEDAADLGHAVARWMADTLLPGFGVDAPADTGMEAAAFHALIDPGSGSDVEFDWEGLPYRLDLAGPTARSAIAIRDATSGPRLEHLMVLIEIVRELDVGTIPGHLPRLIADLVRSRSVWAGRAPGDTVPGLEDLDAAIQSLEAIGESPQPDSVARARRSVLSAIDSAASDVLPGLVYALAMSPAAGPAEIYAEASRFHDFGTEVFGSEFRTLAWAQPKVEARAEGGSRVAGSLFGLDLARATDQLRRVASAGLTEQPLLVETDRQTVAERIALRSRETDWPLDGARVADAIRRGRQIVASWPVTPPAGGELERVLVGAAMSPWRIALVGRLVAIRDWAALDGFVTVTDLYRLGTSDVLPGGWAQSGRLVDGCWCLRPTDRRAPEDWLGSTVGIAASVFGDLSLRLTELLEAQGLPHVLLEALLPMAAQDLVDHARQISTSDWEALAWARRLTPARLEDYLLALVAEGLLAPPRDRPTVAERR